MTPDVQYKLMRLLDDNPGMSQRDIARELGMSLGKVNYCLQAVMRKGWIKAVNFKNSRRKVAYLYRLTPRGIDAKARLAINFLRLKLREYEALREEIDRLHREVQVPRSN